MASKSFFVRPFLDFLLHAYPVDRQVYPMGPNLFSFFSASSNSPSPGMPNHAERELLSSLKVRFKYLPRNRQGVGPSGSLHILKGIPASNSKPSHFRFRHDSRPCRCRLSVRDDSPPPSPPPPPVIDGQLKWRPMTDQKCPVLNSKLTNQPLLPLSLDVGSSTLPNKKVHGIDSSQATWKKRMSLIFVAPLLVGFLVRQFNRRRREESWEL